MPVFAVLYNLIRKLVHKGVQFRKKQEEERENSPKEEAGKIEKTASVEAIFEEKSKRFYSKQFVSHKRHDAYPLEEER